MNPRRRVLLLLLALVAGSLPVLGLPTAAHAVTARTTTLSLGVDYSTRLYSQTYALHVALLTGGKLVPDGYGRITVQSRVPGGSWKTFATTTALQGHTWRLVARRNVSYRAHYAGDTSSAVVLSPSTSTTVTEHVRRNLHDSFNGKDFVVRGTVAPAYGHRAITLQRAGCPHGCAWHRVTSFRTDGSSHYRHKLPYYRARSTYFRLMIPAGGVFSTSYSNHWFETYPA